MADGGRAGQDGLSAGQVARRLGVAVTTVRSWDRRYGIGPAHREEGRHRRYDEHDVQRLEAMRRLTADGVTPAEAARIARALPHPDHPAAGPNGDGPAARPDPAGRPDPAAWPDPAARRGLRRAALALDSGQLDRILAAAVTADVASAWTGLICPVLQDVGERTTVAAEHVAAEHLLSRSVSWALAAVPRPPAAPRVLLSCTADEQHTLPLEALAAALAARGLASRLLGARVPVTALAAAVRRTGPTAVVLWSHHPGTADPAALRAVTGARPRPALVAAAGPGWPRDTLPADVLTPADLPDALAAIAETVTAAARP